MTDDIDAFELEAVLDGLEYSGAPPHLVAHLRALVRAEGWGWDLAPEFADMPMRRHVMRGWREFGTQPGEPSAHTPSGPSEQAWWTPGHDQAADAAERYERLIREGRIGPR